jgi:hypothetical protein
MTTDIFADIGTPEPYDEDGFGELGPDVTIPPMIEQYETYRLVPHPLTLARVRMGRPSSFGGTLADGFTLTEWKIAQAVLGVSKYEDLYVMANSHPTPPEPIEQREKGWWTPWAQYGHEGMDAARSLHGAHLGTAVHRWTEQLDAGTLEVADVPKKFRPHIENYIRVHAELGMEMIPSYRELLIAETSIHETRQTKGLCGRLDALRKHESGWLIVDDTKTGRQAPKGLDEIAIQLAIYANAQWHWEGTEQTGQWVPAPRNVNKEVATITHIPIDRPDEAEIIPVDIVWGLQAAKVVAWVLSYRNAAKRKTKGLRLPLSVLQDLAPLPTASTNSAQDVASQLELW